ncbi:hypothetical protein [Catellatospora sp. IY07-71]|uniref:hypothetical protein n=1 Tax=Catellatospora sp. IY07-71 TaxID=2728827 RepID=UPI001BB32E81|nr:hypothetical protein [Catellatospora sp. IY07-71]
MTPTGTDPNLRHADPSDAAPKQAAGATPVAAPPDAVAPPAVAGAARRFQPLLIALAAALFAVAIVGVWQVVAAPRQAEAARHRLADGYHLVAGGYFSGSEHEEHRAGGVTEVRFRWDESVLHTFAFSLDNPGGHPVVVEEVSRDPGMFRIVDVEVSTPGGRRPFQPVEIAPGRHLVLVLTLRTEAPSGGPCARAWTETLLVRYTVLGVSRSEPVQTRQVIGFQVPGESC